MAEPDVVMQLINTALTFEMHSFLQDLIVLAMLSPDYMAFLSRIMVKSLTIFKSPVPPCHEGIIVKLIDTDDANSHPLLIYLERTASDKHPDQKHFSNHPNSGTVLKSIVHTLKEMPSTLLASLITSGSNDTSSPPSLYLISHIPHLCATSPSSKNQNPIMNPNAHGLTLQLWPVPKFYMPQRNHQAYTTMWRTNS